ncbi:MAG: PEP-CTERM/exosortase system-associated acyltransferase [Luteitalea sp.]
MDQVGIAPWFRAARLDGDPTLLDASYRLRYQVYCLERLFLPAHRYPDKRETDVFDAHAMHFGVLNLQGEVVATARLVRRSEDGLPMFGHCRIQEPHPAVQDTCAPIVEISRLSVSRAYNRRRGDDHYGLAGADGRADGPERRQGGEIVLMLYAALYQTSKRQGYTHVLAAIERPLRRLLGRVGVPLRRIGPFTDYFGPVAPYLIDVSELDRVIVGGTRPILAQFIEGLEPEFCPALVHSPTGPLRILDGRPATPAS